MRRMRNYENAISTPSSHRTLQMICSWVSKSWQHWQSGVQVQSGQDLSSSSSPSYSFQFNPSALGHWTFGKEPCQARRCRCDMCFLVAVVVLSGWSAEPRQSERHRFEHADRLQVLAHNAVKCCVIRPGPCQCWFQLHVLTLIGVHSVHVAHIGPADPNNAKCPSPNPN